MNLKLLIALYIVGTIKAFAGGYDPCSDYPINYGLWAILFCVVFIFSFAIAKKIQLFKQYPILVLSLLLTLILITILVNIPFVKNHLENDYQQKLNCFFTSPNAPTTEQSSEVVEVPQQPQMYLREEFESLVVNKKQEEVISLLGAPYSTSKNGGTEYWYYHEKTTDPITQKADYIVQLIFEFKDGYIVVDSVNFN